MCATQAIAMPSVVCEVLYPASKVHWSDVLNASLPGISFDACLLY